MRVCVATVIYCYNIVASLNISIIGYAYRETNVRTYIKMVAGMVSRPYKSVCLCITFKLHLVRFLAI